MMILMRSKRNKLIVESKGNLMESIRRNRRIKGKERV